MSGAAGTMAGAQRWERSPEVLWRRLSEGVAVLPRDGSAVLTLDGLHAEVWGALGRPVTVGALVDLLGDRLGPDRSVRRQRVAEAVRFLVAAGAVREDPGGSTGARDGWRSARRDVSERPEAPETPEIPETPESSVP